MKNAVNLSKKCIITVVFVIVATLFAPSIALSINEGLNDSESTLTVRIEKIGSEQATAGTPYDYKITVTNQGGENAEVNVLDILGEYKYKLESNSVTSKDPGFYYDDSTGEATWTGVTVEASESIELTLTVTPRSDLTKAETIENNAEVAFGDQTVKADSITTTINPRKVKLHYNYIGNTEGIDYPKEATPPDEQGGVNYGARTNASNPTLYGGWTFDGWYLDSSCSEKFFNSLTPITPDEDSDTLNIYGKWTPVAEMTKNAQVNGSTISEIAADKIFDYVITVKNPTETAISGLTVTDELDENIVYVSGGSYDDTNRTVTFTPVDVPAGSSDNPGKASVTFKAKGKLGLQEAVTVPNSATTNVYGHDLKASKDVKITPKQIKVQYQYKDGSIVPQGTTPPEGENNIYNSSYTAKDKQSYAGYEFHGWYKDAACTEPYQTTQLTAEVTTLYGYWTLLALNLTKTVSPSENEKADKTITAGDNVKYTITVQNNSDTDINNLKVVDEPLDSLLTNVREISDSGEIDSNNVITWDSIHVDKKTASSGGVKQLTFIATINPNAYGIDNVVNGATAYVGENEISIERVVTPIQKLYGEVEYHHVDPPAGAVLPDPQTHLEYGSPHTALPQQDVPGYTFGGWCTDEACEVPYTGSTINSPHKDLYGKFTKEYEFTKSVEKEGEGDIVAGDTLKYTITIKNNSNKDIENLEITDPVDQKNLTDFDPSPSDDNKIHWTVAKIGKNGGEATVSFTAKVTDTLKATTVITNHAETIIGGEPVVSNEVSTTVEVPPDFKDVSVTLGSEIGLNFFVALPDDVTAGTMAYSITGKGGVTGTTDLADAVLQDDGTYKFTAYVNVLQMADKVTAAFTCNGRTYTKTTSVSEYLNKLVENFGSSTETADQAVVAIAKRMADYGHFAQIYLSGVRGFDLSDEPTQKPTTSYATMARIDGTSAIDTGSDRASDYALVNEQGLNFNYSLLLDSNTALKLMFTGADAEPTEVKCNWAKTSGRQTLSIQGGEGSRYVVIEGISAHLLGAPIEVRATFANNSTKIITISALSYANAVLKSDSTTQARKQCMATLLDYYEAVNEYINPKTYALAAGDGGEWKEDAATVTSITVAAGELVPQAGQTITYKGVDGAQHIVTATPNDGYRFNTCTYDKARKAFVADFNKKLTATVPYVVSLWGVNPQGGIATFGPATGKTSDCLVHQHKDGAGCIHNDDWTTIRANLKRNYLYYDDCIAEGCTKEIVLTLNDTIASAAPNSYGNASALYDSINSNYRSWNYRYSNSDQNSVNWANSRLRATLNGKDSMTLSQYAYAENQTADNNDCLDASNCLLSCFPSELQNMIVSKTYRVATSWSTSGDYGITESTSVTDKLWLPSADEVYSTRSDHKAYDESSLNGQRSHFATRLSAPGYAGIGGIKFDKHDCNKAFDESKSANLWWLRSPCRSFNNNVATVSFDGGCANGVVTSTNRALTPCFCIG